MAKIGFVGLGHMGNPMVQNLLRHKHRVKVFDTSQTAIQELVKLGAIPTSSLKELAQDVSVIFTMLPTGQNVKEVCLLDKTGLFKHAAPSTLFIDTSSIDVTTSRELNHLAIEHGYRMIDAPVSGGVAGAIAGTLTFMVGGDEKDFEFAKPILENLGKKIIHVGKAGNGQAAKICNNMILGVSMIVVSEAFTLGKKLGLSPEKLFEICSNSSGQCWALTSYCPEPHILPDVPSSHDYQPGFTCNMMYKDLHLSQIATKEENMLTPLASEAERLYHIFIEKGFGNLDFSAIIKFIQESSR